jgi:hypothetical protein
MTSFVDHMKNITVPSMIQDINEMNHYWAMLTRMPGSGVSAQPNMDVVKPRKKTISVGQRLVPSSRNADKSIYQKMARPQSTDPTNGT